MRNQIEINEKEIEKEIEEERLKCESYKRIRNKSYIPIKFEDFQKLKKSNLLSTPFKTRKPSNEINLIFEMLFDEILLIILSYLSPGEIILFSLTCKEAEYICSDYLLWKQIAIKFQDYFSWNPVVYNSFHYHNYPNIELRGNQFKIQEKNQNDPKQKQIKELSKTNEKIKNYFDNSNSTKRIGYRFYKSNFISIKSERIIYIQNLKNPKQEIEKKGKMIFKEYRKAKQAFIEKEKYEKKYENPIYDESLCSRENYFYEGRESPKYIFNHLILLLNPIILIPTFTILNYYIDSKKEFSIPKLFLLSEINLIITIIWLIYSKKGYKSIKEYYNYSNIELRGNQFKIQEKNQNDPKQKQIKELSKTNEKIKNYFDNSNSTAIRIGYRNYQTNFISIKSERIIYIENLKNPKQEIEKKGKMILQEYRKAKKYYGSKKRESYPYGSKQYFLDEFVTAITIVILITTFIIFNYYIDSKKGFSIPKLFLLSEINLFITIFWIIHSKGSFISKIEYITIFNLASCGLIFMIMISLKTSKIFNFIPWLIVLLPPIILFIHFIYQINEISKEFSNERLFQIFWMFIFFYLIIIILFTGLKLDGFIQIKYSKMIYLFIIIEIYFLYYIKNEFENLSDLIGFSILSVILFIILLFLFLYGDGIIKKFWITLIPIYIVLIIPYFISFGISFSSGFNLIGKLFKN